MKADWTQTTLGAVCKLQSGAGFPVKYQGRKAGQFPFFKVSDMNLEGNEEELVIANNYISDEVRSSLGARIFPSGSVVFPKVGGAIATNKKRRTTQPSCVDNNVMGLIPKVELIDPEYLFKWVQGFDIYEFSNKANPPSITQASVSSWPIWLPPLGEQKRIVAILDQAFAALDRARVHAEANLADADDLQGGLIASAIDQATAGGTESIKLGKLCKIARGGSPRPIKKFMTNSANGINWIKISDATVSGKFIESTQEKITKDGVSRSRFVTSGSFLLTNSMSFGRPYILRTDGCIHDGWLVLEPDYSKVDQDYLYYLLGSRQVFSEFDRLAAGSTVRNLNISLVSSVVVKLPPLHKQREAVDRIESAVGLSTRLVERYREQLSDLEALRQSLLQQAFSGQLT